MGSKQEHDDLLKSIYHDVLNDEFCSEKYNFATERNYRDPEHTRHRIVGEFDILGSPIKKEYRVYLEVKSSYNQSGKGRKQIKRAKNFFDQYDVEMYGKVLMPDYDFEEDVKKYLVDLYKTH